MERRVKASKSEKILLALTAAFLCVLLTLFLRDRAALAGAGVETERAVPQEEIVPDVSPLNINTATEEELTALPGIGPELAARVVAYRTESGPFAQIEDIMNVKGIGQGKFDDIAQRITVN